MGRAGLRTAGSDASQHIRPEEADREHHQDERHDQVHEGNQDLTQLQRDTTHGDRVGRHTLAGSRRRGEQGRQDVLRQRLEELSNDATEVERSSQDDDVPGIKHFY